MALNAGKIANLAEEVSEIGWVFSGNFADQIQLGKDMSYSIAIFLYASVVHILSIREDNPQLKRQILADTIGIISFLVAAIALICILFKVILLFWV